LDLRLAILHSALVFVILSAVLVVSYFALRTRVEDQDRDAVLFRLNQYSSVYKRTGLTGVIDLASLRKGRAQKAYFVRVATAANESLFERDADDWAEFEPQQLHEKRYDAVGIHWISLPSEEGYALLVATARLPDGTLIQVGKSTEEAFLLLAQYRLVVLTMLAISIPVSFAGGALLARRALRPIRSLTRTVREIEETARFSMRAPERGTGDEIDELSRVFNAAMGRIERLLKTMRESLDNVAHDLRTPMTRMRNRAQNSLEGASDPVVLREALIGCLEESDLVLEILNTLMDIAEAEAGLTKTAVKLVSLVGIATYVRDLYSEVAEDQEITLSQDVWDDCIVRGDSLLLTRVVANLVDNALKYTPRGGAVNIEGRSDERFVWLSVRDSGIGISPKDLPKVWERLFRGDRSRSKRGLGLGLSLVKAAVEAAGGRVEAESLPDKGSTFTVMFPVPSGEPRGRNLTSS
jgi:signal transduction histidine kinase